jgi:hypothetical protein
LQDRGLNATTFEQAKHMLYGMLGWHSATGVPLASKLHELDISWVVDKIPAAE